MVVDWTQWTDKDLTRTASQLATFWARVPFLSARTYHKNGYNRHKNSHTEQSRLSPILEPTASIQPEPKKKKVPGIANRKPIGK